MRAIGNRAFPPNVGYGHGEGCGDDDGGGEGRGSHPAFTSQTAPWGRYDPLGAANYGLGRVTVALWNPTPDDFKAIVIYAQVLEATC